jgi:hypothetical protein
MIKYAEECVVVKRFYFLTQVVPFMMSLSGADVTGCPGGHRVAKR